MKPHPKQTDTDSRQARQKANGEQAKTKWKQKRKTGNGKRGTKNKMHTTWQPTDVLFTQKYTLPKPTDDKTKPTDDKAKPTDDKTKPTDNKTKQTRCHRRLAAEKPTDKANTKQEKCCLKKTEKRQPAIQTRQQR